MLSRRYFVEGWREPNIQEPDIMYKKVGFEYKIVGKFYQIKLSVSAKAPPSVNRFILARPNHNGRTLFTFWDARYTHLRGSEGESTPQGINWRKVNRYLGSLDQIVYFAQRGKGRLLYFYIDGFNL